MFSYYGSKSKIINLYPAPKYDRIIEPFAGSARYSLKYFERDVLLIDKYDVIVKIWHYLQNASERDIMALPEPKYHESIDSFNLSEGERLLMGFLVARGVRRPQRIVQKFSDIGMYKKQIASQLYKVKHWKIMQDDYKSIENQSATWFIDAPYQFGGELYNVCERDQVIDFHELSKWCKSRIGQVIVCENIKADWLSFRPIKNFRGAYSRTIESMWCNDLEQIEMDIV